MAEIPTEAMLDAAMKEMGEYVEPYTAPRESGVAIECDISAEDAAEFNAETKGNYRRLFWAMIDAAPPDLQAAFKTAVAAD